MKLIATWGEIADEVLGDEFTFDSALAFIETLENADSPLIEGADLILIDGENEWFLDSDGTRLFWSKIE
jgi:hypothetical protein